MNPGRVTVSVACAVGFLTGLRALIAVDVPELAPLVALEPIPRETFGIDWTELARWPSETRTAALSALLRTLTGLLFAAASAAALNGAIVLAEATGARTQELAARFALGASPRMLTRQLVGELRTRLVAGVAFGLIAGATGGLALRMSWPHALEPVHTGALGPFPADLVILVGLVVLFECLAHLSGLRTATRRGRAAETLRVGARSTSAPAAIFLRRTLAAVHVGVTGAILISAVALTSAVSEARSPDRGATSDVQVATLVGGVRVNWDEVLETVSSVPGIEAGSLAAPGTLLGIGILDVVTTECGNCWRGLFPAPLWNTLADHHAVTHDYFGLNELQVSEGRDFEPSDSQGEPVVIINRFLADTAFEQGRPLGKRVKLGSGVGSWYTIVGVVEDEPIVALGAAASPRPAVYLNAFQRPLKTADLLVRGEDDAIAAALDRVRDLGHTGAAPARIKEWRAQQSTSLAWARWVAASVALAALLITFSGVRAVGVQIARRRIRDLAIRRALGASDGALKWTLMTERVRTAAWGLVGFVFFGTMSVALIEQGAGAAPPPPATWVLIALFLVLASAGASYESLQTVQDTDPARLME